MNGARGRSVQTLCVLLIYCLFAVCSLLLILTGASAYREISRKMDGDNQLRASLSYVANKVRAGEEAGGIVLKKSGDTDVLTIAAEYDGDAYLTYLYWYDGTLMEQFLGETDPFLPADGEKVTPLKRFSMTRRGGVLTLSATADTGRQASMTVCLRTS